MIHLTLQFLFTTQVGYQRFFQELRRQFCAAWRDEPAAIFANRSFLNSAGQAIALRNWQVFYHQLLWQRPETEMDTIAQRLQCYNLKTPLSQSTITAIWTAIEQADDWQLFAEAINDFR